MVREMVTACSSRIIVISADRAHLDLPILQSKHQQLSVDQWCTSLMAHSFRSLSSVLRYSGKKIIYHIHFGHQLPSFKTSLFMRAYAVYNVSYGRNPWQ